jgi:predicted secreted protein
LIDDQSGETEASQKALIDAKRNRNIISIQVQYPGGSKDEGDAIVEELTTSAGYDEMATVDVSLQGTGPLTRS